MADPNTSAALKQELSNLEVAVEALQAQLNQLKAQAGMAVAPTDAPVAAAAEAAHHAAAGSDVIVTGLTVLVLGIFVGYHVVWRVTPALHSPLMGVTNAISSVIVVGAIMALGLTVDNSSGTVFAQVMGFLAVMLASVNIFGGFIVTQRMLGMFKKKA